MYNILKKPDNILTHERNNGINFIGAPLFWELGYKGQETVVAIIDTGCDITHEELKDNIIGVFNFTSDDNCDANIVNDYTGHGTHVAGIIGARNKKRLIGIAPKTKLLILKAIGSKNISTSENLINAIEYAISWKGPNGEKVDIINMSLGTKENNEKLREVIDEAIDNNIFITVASGNSGDGQESTDEILYPGYYKEVIQIGSVGISLKPTFFSNTNQNIDFLSLGENVYSTYPEDQYKSFSGTSMATPQITGVISLILSYFKNENLIISQESIYQYLIKHSIKLDNSGIRTQGNGVVKL
ncbi:peptidase S8 [Priestia megaterium]|uniref:S8 family peptidase n=1 Tax=Priestia megaterium TaxID=1404 RepID=UPI000BFA06F6|nr:S8 family peptidase [Priestia megaterium]PEZ06121.1 peptidase S8 [Priestia megaterium]